MLQPKRWADEPEEEGEYSEEQVQDILRSVLGLPHLVLDGREQMEPPPACAEAEEPADAMTAEGLAIWRAHAGRHCLPQRLHMAPHRTAPPSWARRGAERKSPAPP